MGINWRKSLRLSAIPRASCMEHASPAANKTIKAEKVISLIALSFRIESELLKLLNPTYFKPVGNVEQIEGVPHWDVMGDQSSTAG